MYVLNSKIRNILQYHKIFVKSFIKRFKTYISCPDIISEDYR